MSFDEIMEYGNIYLVWGFFIVGILRLSIGYCSFIVFIFVDCGRYSGWEINEDVSIGGMIGKLVWL